RPSGRRGVSVGSQAGSMARRGSLPGKGGLGGNKGSPPHNKTQRRLVPHPQTTPPLSRAPRGQGGLPPPPPPPPPLREERRHRRLPDRHARPQAARGSPAPEAPHRGREGAPGRSGGVSRRGRSRGPPSASSRRKPGSIMRPPGFRLSPE